MNIGFWEVAAIALVALIFFGPSRLPGLGRSVGEAIRGFKKAMNETDDSTNTGSNSQEKLNSAPPRSQNEAASKTKETAGGESEQG